MILEVQIGDGQLEIALDRGFIASAFGVATSDLAGDFFKGGNVREIGSENDLSTKRVQQIVEFALLSPGIAQLVVEGRQPDFPSSYWCLKHEVPIKLGRAGDAHRYSLRHCFLKQERRFLQSETLADEEVSKGEICALRKLASRASHGNENTIPGVSQRAQIWRDGWQSVGESK